jgi:hypothetical protein
MVFYYILLQVLQASVTLIFINAEKLVPVVLYPLSVILFIGFFFISVKVAKTILNTRTVFAVLLEIMVTTELVAFGLFADTEDSGFPFLIIAVAGIALTLTVILFIVFREFSLKYVVRNVIFTLLYKASLALTFMIFGIDTNSGAMFFGMFGILIFLTAFFFLKNNGKKPVDVKYTAADAIVLFVGTVPFIVDYLIGIFVLILLWSLFR